MRRALSLIAGLWLAAAMAAAPVQAQQDPVAQRAVEGAKAYIKAKNLTNPKLTILLMTGFADQRERASGLEAIVHDVVTKPFAIADIRTAVADALASRPAQ